MMILVNFLLHAENFARIPIVGGWFARKLQAKAQTLASRTKGLPDPDISVVIRAKNDEAYATQWFEDLAAQDFTGDIEVIVVDTSSTDRTAEIARTHGAKVVTITQEEFTYPHALNVGFRAATHPYVVTLVGHSNLTSSMMLKALTYWCQREDFAGIYGFSLPNKNASFWERLGSALVLPPYLRATKIMHKSAGGLLGANGSIVKREVWERLGGYDERYAGGGEDTALGRSMLAAGLLVVREPLCMVFHSHGLGFADGLRQLRHWGQVARPRPQAFNTARLLKRRPDLARKHRV